MTTQEAIAQIDAIIVGLKGAEDLDSLMIQMSLHTLRGTLIGHPMMKGRYLDVLNDFNKEAVELYSRH